MISDIINAELVVADLTDLNPNAFYELGIRHATEEPTIHIARMGAVLPFDNVTHRTIFVDLGDWHSIEQARNRLADSVRAIKAPDYKVSNPITQANASFKMRQSEDPRDRVLAEVQERMSAVESAISGSRTIAVSANIESANQDLVAAHIANALRRGHKLEAIGFYRDLTGADLKTAKNFIEKIDRRLWEEARLIHSKVVKGNFGVTSSFIERIGSRLDP
jgi:ribosomal protein L7/L12